MDKITTIIPDVEVLLRLAPEELAWPVLRLASQRLRNGTIHSSTFAPDFEDSYGNECPYTAHRRPEAQLAIEESWNWLRTQGLLVPLPGTDGANGHVRLSRRAQQLLDETSFKTYVGSLEFPKALLHPSIAEDVWLDIVRGDPGTAVFKAFRAVEVAVRAAGGFADKDVGTTLMRAAFEPKNGPLTDKALPDAEREAMAHFFTGAIGLFKNPHSHRTVTIKDVRAAQGQLMVATELLRIVDERIASRAGAAA